MPADPAHKFVKGDRVILDCPGFRREAGTFDFYCGEMSCEIVSDRWTMGYPGRPIHMNVNWAYLRPEVDPVPRAL